MLGFLRNLFYPIDLVLRVILIRFSGRSSTMKNLLGSTRALKGLLQANQIETKEIHKFSLNQKRRNKCKTTLSNPSNLKKTEIMKIR